jgi:hypothetical protein
MYFMASMSDDADGLLFHSEGEATRYLAITICGVRDARQPRMIHSRATFQIALAIPVRILPRSSSGFV